MAMVYRCALSHLVLVLKLARGADSRHFDDVRISAAPAQHVANPGFPIRSAGGVGAYVSIQARAQEALRDYVLDPSPDHVRPARGVVRVCANGCVDGATARSACPELHLRRSDS
jgi:hypothetical protein